MVVAENGVETMDDVYHPLVCGSGICRALIVKYAKLFKSCRNSAPGTMGWLARRSKALRNFADSCANPDPGNAQAVVRQAVKVQGLLDELSSVELREAEEFVKNLVVQTVGSSALATPTSLVVLARPALDTVGRNKVAAGIIHKK